MPELRHAYAAAYAAEAVPCAPVHQPARSANRGLRTRHAQPTERRSTNFPASPAVAAPMPAVLMSTANTPARLANQKRPGRRCMRSAGHLAGDEHRLVRLRPCRAPDCVAPYWHEQRLGSCNRSSIQSASAPPGRADSMSIRSTAGQDQGHGNCSRMRVSLSV